jgi:hypothetical protein
MGTSVGVPEIAYGVGGSRSRQNTIPTAAILPPRVSGRTSGPPPSHPFDLAGGLVPSLHTSSRRYDEDDNKPVWPTWLGCGRPALQECDTYSHQQSICENVIVVLQSPYFSLLYGPSIKPMSFYYSNFAWLNVNLQ